MLVLCIFPFGSNAFLEQVVVGFYGEIRAGGDVVLLEKSVYEVTELRSEDGKFACNLRRLPRILRHCRKTLPL